MAEVDRAADLARIEVEQRAARLAAEKERAEAMRIADIEKKMQQARARLILDQRRSE